MNGSCPNCSIVNPIQDTGYVRFRTADTETASIVKTLLLQQGIDCGEEVRLPYSSKEQLLTMLQNLQAELSAEHASSLDFSVIQGFEAAPRYGTDTSFASFREFLARLQHHDLVSYIQRSAFTSYMQPILTTSNQAVYGYEFVLRPHGEHVSFKPYELFQVAQETGLHSFLDRQARISAIRVSAQYLPKGVKRFINFLPSSIYNPEFCLNHTFHAIEEFSLEPEDFVFEVVETERIEHIGHLQSIFQVYQRNGVKVALDDVGAGFNTTSVLEALRPDYVKIDRELISHCEQDRMKQSKIQEIMSIAGHYGATVLAEGIERREEYDYCRDIGMHLVQGYLFGKPEREPLGLREGKPIPPSA